MRIEKESIKKNNAISESLGLMGKCEYYEKKNTVIRPFVCLYHASRQCVF